MIVVGIFLAIVVCILVLWVITSTKNRYGEELEISNLSSYTAGNPSNQNNIDAIQRNLLLTVNKNLSKPVKGDSVKDIIVRKRTYVQSFNSQNRVHSVGFIVDIKSLRQSYNVTYQWSDDGSTKYLDEYGTGVTCLAIDKLIYGDFNCVDTQILEKGRQYYNPVEKILPRIVEYKYSIKSYKTILDTDKATLDVEAFVPSWADKAATLDSYSNEIKEWIKSKKLNPDNYYFNYIY